MRRNGALKRSSFRAGKNWYSLCGCGLRSGTSDSFVLSHSMNIYSTLQIGEFHTNHCEDFLVIEQLTSKQLLIAILDGCTMGKESVFASMLFGKIIRKQAKRKFYEDFIQPIDLSLEEQLKSITLGLMEQSAFVKNNLGLETNELLSTLTLGIVDKTNYAAELLTIGDSLVFADGICYEYEQDDKPDYIGYHLSENFEEWYENQEQRLSLTNTQNLSICTDGIFTFKNFKNPDLQKSEKEIIQFFLEDQEGSDLNNFLDNKIRMMKEQMGHVVTDDLAIVRIIRTE